MLFSITVPDNSSYFYPLKGLCLNKFLNTFSFESKSFLRHHYYSLDWKMECLQLNVVQINVDMNVRWNALCEDIELFMAYEEFTFRLGSQIGFYDFFGSVRFIMILTNTI